MAIKWNLRKVMAKNDIWTGIELKRKMKDITGYDLSTASISSLINDRPKMIRVDTLDALCTTLNCSPNDLIDHEKSVKINNVNSENEYLRTEEIKQRQLPPI